MGAAGLPAAASAATVTGAVVAQPPVAVTITQVPGQTPAPGDFFVDPYQIQDSPTIGPEIVDSQGRVRWFLPLATKVGASNFQVQTYHGQKVLTFWEGSTGNPAFGAIGGIGVGQGEDVIMNSHYKVIATLKGVDGLQPDAHEFTLTPNGDALVTAYNVVPSQQVEVKYPNLVSLGVGDFDITDSHALVIDVKTGQIVMNWDALDHVPLTASNQADANPWDYFHINSISLAPDGGYLISGRNTWALYDVNPQTGAINWQLGGHGSSFNLGQGVQFAWQHDSRFVSPTEISLFDDGSGNPYYPSELTSRAEWINLDFAAHKATLARQIEQPSGQTQAYSQGSVQDLADGGTVVGWGSAGTFTEYSPSGALVLTGRLPADGTTTVDGVPLENNWQTYRTFKEAWVGTPDTRPTVAATSQGSGTWNISAAWNGDTQVVRWTVRAGTTRSDLKVIETVPWNGLSTSIPLAGPSYRYVQVEALSDKGPLAHGLSYLMALP